MNLAYHPDCYQCRKEAGKPPAGVSESHLCLPHLLAERNRLLTVVQDLRDALYACMGSADRALLGVNQIAETKAVLARATAALEGQSAPEEQQLLDTEEEPVCTCHNELTSRNCPVHAPRVTKRQIGTVQPVPQPDALVEALRERVIAAIRRAPSWTEEITDGSVEVVALGHALAAVESALAVPRPERSYSAEDRLTRIKEIIEGVDQRCMAVDGPVTPTLQEINAEEMTEIYMLAKGCGQT